MEPGWCVACKTTKSNAEFDHDHRTLTGFRVFCKQCWSILSPEDRYSFYKDAYKTVSSNISRAGKLGLPGIWSYEEWYAARYYFGFSCAVCGQNYRRLVADHWINLNAPECPGTVCYNMLPLCTWCNTCKSDKRPEYWLGHWFNDASDIIEKVNVYFKWIRKSRIWQYGELLHAVKLEGQE